jgi:hypothetical protein
LLTRLGNPFEALAVTGKDLDAKFFLKLDDRLGDPGLRGMQGFGGFGQVEVASNRFLNKAKLV